MDCKTKLSCVLRSVGFFNALGTPDMVGGRTAQPPEGLVKKGTPFTYDTNNGVAVVNDEDGHPWIWYLDKPVPQEYTDAVRPFHLLRGAYVPHSNDGGYFVRIVLPELLKDKD
ncbi:MAG: hypothetical protein QF858_04170 [Candidatus Pacebacteria bacterium]|nr:hypothetical protein [Candidatus Paceibacterota bacterium]